MSTASGAPSTTTTTTTTTTPTTTTTRTKPTSTQMFDESTTMITTKPISAGLAKSIYASVISVMHPRPRLIDSLLDDVPYFCSRPDWGRDWSVATDPVKESQCRLAKKSHRVANRRCRALPCWKTKKDEKCVHFMHSKQKLYDYEVVPAALFIISSFFVIAILSSKLSVYSVHCSSVTECCYDKTGFFYFYYAIPIHNRIPISSPKAPPVFI